MALDATKWEVQADKDIRYIGPVHTASGANWVTVLELHRWLQDLADDASAASDDFMDITKDTPSDKSFDTIINLINGYNIDDVTAEYIYGGSIIQADGAVIYDGVQIIAGAGAHVEIVQDGAIIAGDFWNSVPDGSGNKGINADAANGISHRFMVKVRTAAADIDGRRLLFQTREWTKSYSEFKINGTGRGVNVVPLTYVTDLNNATLEATAAGWTEINNVTEGYIGIDVNNNAVDEYFYSKWNRHTYTINEFYERMKWLTRRGSASTIYGLNGELFRGITHEVAYSSLTGTFDEANPVSWSGAAVGTGQVLADNGSNKLWLQHLTGAPPVSGVALSQTAPDAASATAGTVTERALSFPFCGVSTGSAIIGAFGFGMEATDLGTNDKVFDLAGAQWSPPNYVSFTVSNLLITGQADYLLVTPADGLAIDLNFFTLNGALSGPTVTSVVVNEAIPSDTPSPTGTIRILRANGSYTRHNYTAWSGNTFTIESHDFSTNNAANGANCFPSYIDKTATATSEAFTGIYTGSPRTLYIRVRNSVADPPTNPPIKTFEGNGSLGAAGGSASVGRVSDA